MAVIRDYSNPTGNQNTYQTPPIDCEVIPYGNFLEPRITPANISGSSSPTVGVNIGSGTGQPGPPGSPGVKGDKGDPGTAGNVVSYPITNASSTLIDHNLGYYPIVQVFDADGFLIETDVENFDLNSVYVIWPAPFTGTVTLA